MNNVALVQMPVPEIRVQTYNSTIGSLILNYEEFCDANNGYRRQYPWAARFVMGFPLPSWQRPLVWSAEQKERFITSIWCGIDIGSYMVNTGHLALGLTTMVKFSDILLDGQQRMYAIEQYIESKLAVEDVNGIPRLWEALPLIEKRRFRNTTFVRKEVDCFDEGMLRKQYDLNNFGGTAHTEDQRAFKEQHNV